MAKDDATEEVTVDDDVPVDEVLADAQDTLADIEGGEHDDLGGLDGSSGVSTDGVDEPPSPDPVPDRRVETDDDGSLLPSLPDNLFSAKHFLGGGLVAGLGALLGSGLLTPIPVVGTIVGLALGAAGGTALAGFLLGAASSRSSYLEVALLGAIVGAGGAAPVGTALIPVLGLGIGVFAVGAVVAALLGVVGHYLGRDLRSGLTRDVGGDDGPL